MSGAVTEDVGGKSVEIFSMEPPLLSSELLGTFDDTGSSVSLHTGTLLFLSRDVKI